MNSAKSRLPENLPLLAQNDPDLASVVAAWSELPDAVKARIVGLVEGAFAARGPKSE
ncbi:MAG: hypothetical protein HY287_15890 [Planctomycetes bacterium]|nr:hypothetical protein [Planctomycetota bacterium]MBI3835808.1 hypothetical protein [Planctomycetota bacterium]